MNTEEKEPRQPKHTEPEPRLLYSAAGVGYLIGVCGRTIKDWCKVGKFPPPDIVDGKHGHIKRWYRETILKWIEEKKQATGVAV